MGEDAPLVPAPPVPGSAPGPEAQTPAPPAPPGSLKPTKALSLSEIVEATEEATESGPLKPDPILLEWFLPPSRKSPQGKWMQVEVVTQFPPDPWRFGITYMTEVMPKQRSQDPDTEGKKGKKGEMVQMHPNWDVVMLAREVVLQPVWLHNESAVDQLKANVPSVVFAELRRKLMLAAGLTGDFFADYHVLTMPKAVLTSIASGSLNGSDNPPGPSRESPPSGSSPGSSMTGSAAPKTAESASATTSGSSPSTPTTARPA